MLKYKKGNLLTAKGHIVHGCNARGVMGSGIAMQASGTNPKVIVYDL